MGPHSRLWPGDGKPYQSTVRAAWKQVWGPFRRSTRIVWPAHEHSIFVDYHDNVWVDDGFAPSHILKFTPTDRSSSCSSGKGDKEEGQSNDDRRTSRPHGILVDPRRTKCSWLMATGIGASLSLT